MYESVGASVLKAANMAFNQITNIEKENIFFQPFIYHVLNTILMWWESHQIHSASIATENLDIISHWSNNILCAQPYFCGSVVRCRRTKLFIFQWIQPLAAQCFSQETGEGFFSDMPLFVCLAGLCVVILGMSLCSFYFNTEGGWFGVKNELCC